VRSVVCSLVLLTFLVLSVPRLFGQLVGQGEFSAVAGMYSAQYLPKVDIRQFISTPYPTTVFQVQTDDFGADLNMALLFAGAGGACVDLSGINFAGTVYAETNPFAGLSSTWEPCIVGGNIDIVTSVMISTPAGGLYIEGFPISAGTSPGGLYFTACNVSGGCGPNSYPVYTPSTGSTGCATAGGLNCVASSTPSSSALATPYKTGTVTVTNGSTTVTGAGGAAFTAAMVGGFFISNCVPTTCLLPLTSYTAARIVAAASGTVGGCVSGATVLCLESAWTGTTHGGRQYIIWYPNTSVVICDGCLALSMDSDTFGHVWRNVGIDIAGVYGGVGYFAKACQERCEYDNFRVVMQGSSVVTTPAGTCGVWDGTLRGSAGTDGNQNNTGTGHASAKTMECDVGQNAGGTNSYGWVVTEYDLIQQKQTSGPNDFQIGSVVGKTGHLLEDAVFLDGFFRGFFYGGHIESVSNDGIEVGLNNAVYGVTISGIDYANPGATNVIEFHSGSTGNVAIGTTMEVAGCIVADDNLGATLACTATATSSATTQSEPLYSQAGNNSNAAVFGGNVELNSTSVYGWGSGTSTSTPDTGLSRLAPAWAVVGNGTGKNQGAVIQSADSSRLLATTTIASTSFTTILAFPSVPINTGVSFHCDIMWEQSTAVSTVTFGMGMNNAPVATSLWVESLIYSTQTAAPVSLYTSITSTAQTAITAATAPGNFGVVNVLTVFGALSTSTSTVVLTVYGKSGNASDALVVEPGSTCFLTP
jgi:hypothetical protein